LKRKLHSYLTSVKMSSSIDMSLLPPSTPSLCIPRVFANITKERVAFVIRDVGLGEIDHIDMVQRTAENGDKFQRVFIHFVKWGVTASAQRARERIMGGKEIKIIYDDPWFWKLSANRSVKNTESRGDNAQRRKVRPRIVDEDGPSECDDALLSRKSVKREPSAVLEDEHFRPSSPINPPPSDEGWIKVEYGSQETTKPKARRVIKPKATVDKPKATVDKPKAT
jgi:hypothetical protein